MGTWGGSPLRQFLALEPCLWLAPPGTQSCPGLGTDFSVTLLRMKLPTCSCQPQRAVLSGNPEAGIRIYPLSHVPFHTRDCHLFMLTENPCPYCKGRAVAFGALGLGREAPARGRPWLCPTPSLSHAPHSSLPGPLGGGCASTCFSQGRRESWRRLGRHHPI